MSLEIAPDEEEENSKHYKNAILFIIHLRRNGFVSLQEKSLLMWKL